MAGGGEVRSALKAGADPSRLVLHGNAKTDEDIRHAVDVGLGLVVVDGPDDVDRLEAIVAPGSRQDVLVRVIPGVTADTHEHVKRGSKTFVAVDGGMGDNLDVALYAQRFEAAIADRMDGTDMETTTVVGRHCESGDVLIDGVPLSSPRVGDLLVVPATGAYCFTMSNNYNGSRRIPVVFARDGEARPVVGREAWDELLARDVD